ncbi:hypothetical protein FQA39_LY04882 [Lamprigera yunnana]|nr:hypothetical protein FQA39_LY04882 [Lamprigera yunnana]
MWIAYAEQGRTKAVDLKTVAERLHDQFNALEFYAEYEAVYGLEKGYSVIECTELQVKYEKAVKLCDQFVQVTTGTDCSTTVLRSESSQREQFYFTVVQLKKRNAMGEVEVNIEEPKRSTPKAALPIVARRLP